MTTTANRTESGDRCEECRRASLVTAQPSKPYRLICPACGTAVKW